MQAQEPKATRLMNAVAMTVALGLLAATTVQAAPIRVNATEDSAQPGFFTLDFGAKIGSTSGQITSTDYGLEVDPEAGTARLVDYYQEVESLNLFGFPTGAITVEVVPGSSTGTYDKTTREFTTTELYSISFTADLSAFGLFSPIELPSTSTGTVDITPGGLNSHVNLQWAGSSDIIAGQEFTYTCEVNTEFSASTIQILDIGLKSSVLELNLSQSYEDQLIGPLDMTTLRLQQRNIGSATRNLEVFIAKVDSFSPGIISVFDANAIIADANFVLNKIKPRRRLK